LCVYIYATLQNVIKLSVTSTMLCHMKGDPPSKFLHFTRKTWKIAMSLQQYDLPPQNLARWCTTDRDRQTDTLITILRFVHSCAISHAICLREPSLVLNIQEYKLFKPRFTASIRQKVFVDRVINVWSALLSTIKFYIFRRFRNSIEKIDFF